MFDETRKPTYRRTSLRGLVLGNVRGNDLVTGSRPLLPVTTCGAVAFEGRDRTEIREGLALRVHAGGRGRAREVGGVEAVVAAFKAGGACHGAQGRGRACQDNT